MKKSDAVRRKTWRMLAKNLIVLVALAVTATLGVIAWFSQNIIVTADSVNVCAHMGKELEFYVMPPSDGNQYNAIHDRLAANADYNEAHPSAIQKRSTWHTGDESDVTFDFNDQEFQFMDALFLSDVTSDGSSFQIPKLLQYNHIAYVDETQPFETATANDAYMSFDMYFRSCKTDQVPTVVLMSDSSITTPHVTHSAEIIDNFSKENHENNQNAAIGAVRMSVLNMENSASREVLWIPGPDVYYNGLEDTLYTGLNSSSYANKGAVYYNGTGLALRCDEGTHDHAYYASNDNRQVIQSHAENMFVGSSLGSNQEVLTLNHKAGDYYYGHIRINLWIEGEDAEARLACVGSQFQVSLHFEMEV